MKHDGKIDIATGLRANTKNWKNKKVKWSSLVRKLTTEHKTNETLKEYANASKTERGRIKDVGGYFGGYLRGGRRKPQNVLHKQLITLDVDYAHLDFWDDFTMLFSNAAVLHATHSYTEASPRYRLIMPLTREVTPDGYVAIARKIADGMGIELFDNTTFQVHRFMYYPSNSADAEYYYRVQDREWIDPDEILEQYVDWTDTSEWATSAKNLQAVRDASKRQQDPEAKNNVIGMFCRTYGIAETIDTFLKDQYKPVHGERERYTYTGGSTAGGLITYDDKFAFSHHGTDPISGQLCNAFDLVRVHHFGHLDTEGQKIPTKKKSYKAMIKLCTEDAKVKRLIATESLASAKMDFADEEDEDEPEDVELDETDVAWAEKLQIDGRGKYLSSSKNLNIILTNDPVLKGAFKYNEFDCKRYVAKNLAWRKVEGLEPIRNVDYSGVRNYVETVYGIVGSQKIDDALAIQFERNKFHPVKEYLNSIKWDEKPRIDELLIDHFNTPDTLYTREAMRVMMVGAVSRIFNAGCKFDLVLVLSGKQGTFKSTFIDKLGGEWSSDSFYTFSGKEAYEQLHGAWIIEMAELSAMSKSEIEAAKHFITKNKDSYRPAYARAIETFKRQCVFFATTNKTAFIRDATGGRRFLPVDVFLGAKKDPRDMSKEFVAQLWGEAVHLYKTNAPLYLSDEAKQLAVIEQKQHSEVDERVGVVENYLDKLLPDDWDEMDVNDRRIYLDDELVKGEYERQYVCVAEIWCECLGKSKRDMQRWKTRNINDIMKNINGWKAVNSTRNFKIYGKQRYFKRL